MVYRQVLCKMIVLLLLSQAKHEHAKLQSGHTAGQADIYPLVQFIHYKDFDSQMQQRVPACPKTHPPYTTAYKRTSPHQYSSTSTSFKHLLLVLFVQLALVELATAKCYTTFFYSSTCELCFNDPETILTSCRINATASERCKQVCCGLKYSGKTVNCDLSNSPSTNDAYKLSTIVIILVVCAPLAFCVVRCIYSCTCEAQRSTDRTNHTAHYASRAPISAVNLQLYNIEQSFPYYIDGQQACSICLESGCHIMTLCGHTYHSTCLKAWITKRESCPFCVSDKFNPLALYCTSCKKSVKLQAMYGVMGEQENAEWEAAAQIKCSGCQQGEGEEEEIEISINEEEIERYQKQGERGQKQGERCQQEAGKLGSKEDLARTETALGVSETRINGP